MKLDLNGRDLNVSELKGRTKKLSCLYAGFMIPALQPYTHDETQV